MDKDKAIQLVRDLVAAEVELMKSHDRPRGPSKKRYNEERKAAANLLKALTGEKATDQDIDNMTSY